MSLGTASESVGIASAIIVPANHLRTLLIITNDSDTDIYLSEGDTAVVGSGVLIKPGGSYTTQHGHRSLPFQGAISAIHGGTGSKNVAISER